MQVISDTERKLSSVIAIIDNLQLSEFPHTDASDVLENLKSLVDKRLHTLKKVKPHTDIKIINAACKECLRAIWEIYPLLGFLLRSTNVRNSFELHGPLLRIVKQGFSADDAKLVISSEWEFSPFTDQSPTHFGFKNIVLIGMPASETGNCLVIPLTGHEFGHNLWSKNNLVLEFEQVIEDRIIDYISNDIWDEHKKVFNDIDDPKSLKDMLGRKTWLPSWGWSLAHCEELFCDFIGLLLYRESYLHAFSYLLAPGLPGKRHPDYPNMRSRAEALVQISAAYKIDIPDGYVERFEDAAQPGNDIEKYQICISDHITSMLIDDLGAKANRILVNTYLDDLLKEEEIKHTKNCFGLGVPIVNYASLPSIINAAWEFHIAGMQKWESRYPKIFADEDKKQNMLNDLVFKSIEVLEIHELNS